MCALSKDIQFVKVGEDTLVKFVVNGSRSSAEKVTIEIKPEGIFELTTKTWSKVKAKDDKGVNWKLYTNIKAKSEGEAVLQFKVDGKNINTISLTSKPAGKDVFQYPAAKRYEDEYLLIQPKADAASPAEYSNNYCVQATSRALGKLLNNNKDFWVYDDGKDQVVNRVRLESGTSMGQALDTKGYVKSPFVYNSYYAAMTDKLALQNELEPTTQAERTALFNKYAYTLVQIKTGSSIYQEYIKKEIKDKRGYHVFLLSVSGDFHVLSILIDNTDPCNEEYKIYDQHGLSSSNGKLAEIDEGIRRQVSWTFTNFSLNKGRKLFTTAEAKLWKIQRK